MPWSAARRSHETRSFASPTHVGFAVSPVTARNLLLALCDYIRKYALSYVFMSSETGDSAASGRADPGEVRCVAPRHGQRDNFRHVIWIQPLHGPPQPLEDRRGGLD